MAPPDHDQTPSARKSPRDLRQDMTATEEKLWKYLRAHRLDGLHFRRQHQLGPFIVDFYCHAARLVVEVDGPAHNSRAARDTRRDQWLTAHGHNVLRFDNPRLWWNLPEVLGGIARAARICKAQVEGRKDEV